jgi:phosphatidylserine decarboxylase
MEIIRFLPKKLLSRMVGLLVHINFPSPINNWLIGAFAKYYRISLEEAEKPIDQYPSIGAFFARKLKPGLRPLGESPVVHPADAVISQIGLIQNGQLIQAKGITYSVDELTGNKADVEKFKNGLFVTYYLCPTDYHRVHSPVEANLKSIRHIPGELWPVNNWSVVNVPQVFNHNERLVFELEGRLGATTLVMVGATNVGQMTVSVDSEIVTNHPSFSFPREKSYSGVEVQRGQELGIFNMGSTVIMLYPKTVSSQRGDWETLLNSTTKVAANLL